MILLPLTALLPTQDPHDPKKPSNKTVTGHILRPGLKAPTPDLIEGLRAPAGFHVERWAEGLENPRVVRIRPDGTVYATQRKAQNIVMLKDTDGDGVADVQKEVMSAGDLHGLDFTKDGKTAYVVSIHKVWKVPVLSDGTFGAPKVIVNGLPDAGQHANRTLAVGPDSRLYISVGSTTNVASERNPYNATMVVTDLDGRQKSIYASGLRNTIGFDWSAGGQLFGWDQSIDWKGDDECKEEINAISKGKRYGWPYVYEDGKVDPQQTPMDKGVTLDRWRSESTSPQAMYTAHSAGMQFQFYRGSMFPAEYRGDAFATCHGSWNRLPASGYEVVRVHFENGRAVSVEPFVTGWVQNGDDPETAARWGRPCGLATMPDGSLIVGDDDQGALYRISYGGAEGRSTRLRSLDLSKLTPDLVNGPKNLGARLNAFGLANSEYAPGRAKSPMMTLSNLPKGTKALAIAMEDPDAAAPKPFTHWLVGDIAVATTIPTNVPPGDRALGGVQGGNSHGTVAYYGPKPPQGDPPHRYHFTVYALDGKVGLKPGFNRMGLLKAIQGHVLGQATTVGKFGK